MGDAAWQKAHRDQINKTARARRAHAHPPDPSLAITSKTEAGARLRQRLTDIEAGLLEIQELLSALMSLQIRETLRVIDARLTTLEHASHASRDTPR